MVPDEPISEKHTDTAPGNELVGGVCSSEKVLEEFLLVLLWNTDTGIADGECPVSFILTDFYSDCSSL